MYVRRFGERALRNAGGLRVARLFIQVSATALFLFLLLRLFNKYAIIDRMMSNNLIEDGQQWTKVKIMKIRFRKTMR